jgi:GNAT superfamily N-acetyltransferase
MPTLDLANGYYELPPGKLANVVTCLEMRRPPDCALKQMPTNLTLERFASHDLNGFRELFKAIGGDIMWFSRLIMSDEALTSILSNPLIESFKLLQDNKPIGILELNFTEMPDCELAFFGLVPGAIGTGAGRVLMDEAIRKAWDKPINRFWVHTCTFDAPQALPFYIRSGFTAYTRMVEVHDDPRLTGKLPLTASPQIPLLPKD